MEKEAVENLLPKWSFEVHAPLLHQVNDATHVSLQADGDAHKGCVVVQFSSEGKDLKLV